ncbi:MAG: VCBS repeat-containing protein [Chitinophagaceae bacterium]|nr:VCBS repeat-containing protein [Chitinophagaceae bacterium]
MLLISCTQLQHCTDKKKLFTLLSARTTGIDFSNNLYENSDANVLNYAYFYNGGGVAIGDINQDGLADILFTGNMVPNRLYLNKGNFKFEDVTLHSGIAQMQGWCTGASMADVNGDGKPDIYICRSADTDPVKRRNLLYINNGDGTFTEQAVAYGLADEGYSTQAVFFDYDRDGDLDMFLVNHSLQQYATGDMEKTGMRNQQKPEFSNKLFRNDHGHFINVTREAGITSNVLSFGLGVSVADLNNDGWPDIYVSNDFNEPDYLFINHEGTFREELSECMDQSSLFSMGNDAADIDNDGKTDLVTLDMLPPDNRSQKMHSGAENFDKFQMLYSYGISFQSSRNMLHKNNGDGTFSEIGQLAGISNTDWSWSALLADFDNDGNKDLFVSNGYARDNTNMDFIKYHMDKMMKNRRSGNTKADIPDLIAKMPSVQLPNYLFHNNGNCTFINRSAEWGLDLPAVSSGAAYADLDNDGALDLVVSNINAEASVYRNNSRDLLPDAHYINIQLLGRGGNTNGIGARVTIFCGAHQYTQEEMPVRGFQSSVDPILHVGLGTATQADSIFVVWPDGQEDMVTNIPANRKIVIREGEHKRKNPNKPEAVEGIYFSRLSDPPFSHKENPFNDFTVQPLLPSYLSRPGPCMARADVNGDGLDDIFIGGAAGQPGKILIQDLTGAFIASPSFSIASDSMSEDVSAIFFDADNDGDADLYVASGGYELDKNDPLLQDRLYLNNGHGIFTKASTNLPPLIFSKSCVRAADIDRDGDLDLFVGGRVVPGNYPLFPPSEILLNDGQGHFTIATKDIVPGLDSLGMVTDGKWIDLNNDEYPDLVVAGEWMPIKIFINEKGKLKDRSTQYIHFSSTGWWNCIASADFDGDGNMDLVLGNQGLNNQFTATEQEPITVCYKDFDGDGKVDPIVCYFIGGVSYPIYSKDDLSDQFPWLKKIFPKYNGYASATIHDLFSDTALNGSVVLKAGCMQTVYLHNSGHGSFTRMPLPPEVQYAPVYAIAAENMDAALAPDLLIGGNNQWMRVKFGKYRANHGTMLLNDGKGNFHYVPQWRSGLAIRGDVRSMQFVHGRGTIQLFAGINNDSLLRYRLHHGKD